MKKTAFLLIISMLLSLIACAQSEMVQTETSTVAEEASESAAETERTDVPDNLPAADYDGRNFRIITPDYCEDDFHAEQEEGALINDAVYRRNAIVGERYNVTLVPDYSNSYSNVTSKVKSSILASDDAYDLVIQHMIDLANLATQHLFYDWNTLDYIDVERPWWNYSSYENLSVAGKSYMLIGSISPYFLGSYYCVYFNKNLAENHGLSDDIYTTVLDGKFTIDLYQSLIRDTWEDLNGNGKADDGDFYGLAAQVTSYATPFIYAFGEVTVKRDEEGIPYLDMDGEKYVDMTQKIYDLFYNSNGTITTSDWSLHSETFLDSRALFMNGVFSFSYNSFTSFEDDYGILPYPKWDEEQKTYYTMADGSAPLASVPITSTDIEFVGIITEALAAESWKRVIPTIYDVALKVRGTRDEQSLEVIDIVASNAVLDFGFVYGNYDSMGFFLSNLMSSKKSDFSSYYASRKEKWEKGIEKLVESYINE